MYQPSNKSIKLAAARNLKNWGGVGGGSGRDMPQFCKPSKGQKKAFGKYAEARNQIPFPTIRNQLFFSSGG